MNVKFNFEQLIKNYRIINIENFISYLKDVWQDLSNRTGKKGISKITFSSYYKVPGIIAQRLFSVFDSDNDEYINMKEFINGMKLLFYDSFENSSKFIFNFYDFDKDGLINKNDIRIVLSYINSNNSNNLNNGNNDDNENKNFYVRTYTQDELSNLLDDSFKNFENEQINYNEFIYLIENIGSDIYLLILLFLLENKPFNKNAINEFHNENENNKNSPNKVNKRIKFIASPLNINTNLKLNNFFQRVNKKRKTYTAKLNVKKMSFWKNKIGTQKQKNQNEEENIIFDNEENNLENIPVKRKTNLNTEDESIKSNKNINNIEYKDLNLMPAYKYDKINKDYDISEISENNEKKNIDENIIYFNDEEIEEEDDDNFVKFEGYLYKLIDNIKLKRLWFKLLYKDLYFYSDKEVKIRKGMHHLSGVFLKENLPEIYNGIKFYNFSIIYPKKERVYYTSEEDEYKKWIENLKIATNYTNLNDLYEITKNLGKGKYGLIKLGKNKKTNKEVAIKILCKTNMRNDQLSLIKTEIDILKICHHKNIIHLYDIFENENFFYIIMEYCSGGDLFSYLERNKFHIPERQSCKIIYKILNALSYLHSFGIIHRDIKSENILITYNNDEEFDIRINDFNLSRILGPGEFCNETCGTLSYVAPEILLKKKYNKLVDSWSLGVTCYLLISGSLPFDHPLNDKEIIRKTIYEQPNFRYGIWEKISNECINFISKLLEKNPKKRMTINEALEHEWIKKFGFDKKKKSSNNLTHNFNIESFDDDFVNGKKGKY